MLRTPVYKRSLGRNFLGYGHRCASSSSFIRNTFIEYFTSKHDHKFIKSSSVVPLSDPSVPFVNAGMNQFKGVFLGKVQPPCPRAVNSQKCIRVGGKHNDLEVVGTDGTHHTFFEMLGNWSFGDYYKKEACAMAWDLLLGPYRLKPENLLVTYFGGDVVIGLKEDTECRDIWKSIGVSPDRIRPMDSSHNFWEMGEVGPCGPCTEIHYTHPDGSLTEIWNIVFIQCNRESNGKVTALRTQHVDTGMGLERVTALLQGVPSNYDTDLFQPILRAIHEKSSGLPPYSGCWVGTAAAVDVAYRRLADHARMVSVCLADQVYPVTSLNLRQILRKCFKLSTDVFKCPTGMMEHLYDTVSESLGETYPELITNARSAKMVLQQEEQNYSKFRAEIRKKWHRLRARNPEVDQLGEVELEQFADGYTEFKEILAKQKTAIAPGELVFKLYATYGFQEDLIQRVASLNHVDIDKPGFWKLLEQERARHKTALKEQSDSRSHLFQQTIDNLKKKRHMGTDDRHKYNYSIENNRLDIKTLKTKLLAILNENLEWLDFLDPCENRTYYLVAKDTNFYCEEGGQVADSGSIVINNDVTLKVEIVFKIQDFVFHKGAFNIKESDENKCVSLNKDVHLNVDSEKRFKVMCNHTATHLINCGVRKLLPNSVVSQIGSKVTEKGLSLKLSIYGEKMTEDVVLKLEETINAAISRNAPVVTSISDSVSVLSSNALTVPGERYPDTGLRLVHVQDKDLNSIELCCGTHVPAVSCVGGVCVTHVRAANSAAPTIHAITGEAAMQALELFCRAEKLREIINITPPDRFKAEVSYIKRSLADICGSSGSPRGKYAECLKMIDGLKPKGGADVELEAIAEAEVCEAISSAVSSGSPYVVHFLRCSYLLPSPPRPAAPPASRALPALVVACAQGVLHVCATVPKESVTSEFTARSWLGSVLPVFQAQMAPGATDNMAEMTPTKVSLITCEQLVQDAVRAANEFAGKRTRRERGGRGEGDRRRTN